MVISVLASALEQAQLASLCLATFLYGCFFALFMVTTVIAYHNASESTRQQRMKVLPVSLAMALLANMYIVIVWIRTRHGTGESNEIFYEEISRTSIAFKMACLCTLSVMRDGIIIWRMYALYNKQFVVVAPAVLLMVAYTAVACIVLCIVLGLMPSLPAGADVFKVLEAWISAFFLLTMVTNVLCSGAIALRIFVTGLGSPLRNRTTTWLTALVFVESSTLYALSVIAALTTFLSSFDGRYPALDAIILLVSALIIPQICLHVTALTDSLSESQLLNAAWLEHKGYSEIDEDPEYPLLQTHTTISVSKHAHASFLEPILEIDEPAALWLI